MAKFSIFAVHKDNCYRYITILGIRFRVTRRAAKKQLTRITGTLTRMTPGQMERLIRFSQALSLKQINRDEIASKVENLNRSGVSGNSGTPRLVVSITSYPARMYDLHLCL